MKIRLSIPLLALSLLAIVLAGCGMPGDPMDDMWTQNIYPGTTNTYDVGSIALQYDGGYFRQIYLNGALLVPGIIVETDPVFTGSPAFGITAANILTWNALVSSQWTTDANGIHYNLGSIGVNTPSVATSLVRIYSNNAVANNAALEVGENSASAGARGINVNVLGAKTAATYGISISNAATSGTGGINKYGLYISSTSVWNGAGSTNYGLYIATPTGGTNNIAAYINGVLDMGTHQINNVVDPTLAQDAATKKYVDDRFLKWDDVRTPVTAVKLSGIKPPTWTAYKSSEVLAFSDQVIVGNEELIYFSIQLPHSYLEGSDIYPHLHWVPEDNTGGNVRWQLTYTWANQDAVFGAATTDSINAAAGVTSDKHIYSAFTAIDGNPGGINKTISSMLLCSLKRNSSDALDTYNGKSAYFIEVDFHYQTDSMGSSSELIK